MKTLFISDIHLSEKRPDITKRFIRFLHQEATLADVLYILGDLFEFWVGDDDDSDLHRLVIKTLAALTASGTRVYLMHGNRDFLIKKRFLTQTGCTLLKDPSVITLCHEKILLTHGDMLCTLDKHYLKTRKKLRNRFFQWLFLCLPLKKRLKIACNMRDKSQKAILQKPLNWLDVTQKAVKNSMRCQNVRYLIHGHTHKPHVDHFDLNGEQKTRFVLSDWDHEVQVLSAHCNNKGKLSFEIKNIT